LPSPAAPLVAAAKTLLASEDTLGALAKLDDAYALDPDDEDSLLTGVEVLLSLNRASEANALRAQARTRPIRDERRLAGLKARSVLAAEGGAECAKDFQDT
jgi:hypothetical protein